MTPVIDEILFMCMNLAIASYHAERFDANKKINHTFWAIVVGIVIGMFTWVSRWDWFLCGALVMERIFAFNPLLNFLRKPRKPFFYTHSSPNGSWLDSKIGNSYPYVFMGALAGFIALNIFILI